MHRENDCHIRKEDWPKRHQSFFPIQHLFPWVHHTAHLTKYMWLGFAEFGWDEDGTLYTALPHSKITWCEPCYQKEKARRVTYRGCPSIQISNIHLDHQTSVQMESHPWFPPVEKMTSPWGLLSLGPWTCLSDVGQGNIGDLSIALKKTTVNPLLTAICMVPKVLCRVLS